MIKLIIFVYAVFVLNLFVVVDNKGIRVPLFRQLKSPHEIAANTDNVEEHGIYLDWLKPKPKPHNITNDSIALFRYLDREFYGKIVLGTKGKTLDVLFDTTWSTSWFLSEDCSKIGCWFHSKYDHKKSSSYVKNGSVYNINEGSYNLTGYYSSDTINIAHLRVNNFKFVEMVNVPYINIFSKADGVLGLAMAYGDQKPFIYSLLEQGIIPKPIFAVYLSRDPQSNRGGDIMIGAYDSKHIHVTNKQFDNVTTVPVTSSVGYWEFDMNGVYLYSAKKSNPIDIDCKAMLDTSSNAIISNNKNIDIIHEAIGAKHFMFGRYKVNCDTINKLPWVNFIINGNNFTLTGKEYIQKITYAGYQICISSFVAADTPSEKDKWILGGAFLLEFYSIYDFQKKTIGLVKAA